MTTQSSKQKRGCLWWLGIVLIVILVLASGTWIAGVSAKKKLMAQNPAPGQMVDAGGFKMHIHWTGEGTPTVILVSGLDDFSIMWSLIQPEIARTTRQVMAERREMRGQPVDRRRFGRQSSAIGLGIRALMMPHYFLRKALKR